MNKAIHNLAGGFKNSRSAIALLCCICFPTFVSAAETVVVKLPTGVTASALFHPGRPSQPAVILLHGFLQTYASQPLSSLAGNLASKGYTVLSPTISLGINRRNQSMACEAAHTHTMTEEVAEVDYWVNWLSKKGYKNTVLTGFSSTGNNEILLYNARGSHPAIKQAILISPNPTYRDDAEWQRTLAAANVQRQSNSKKITKYSLGYCKHNFTATVSSYLSYVQYDGHKIQELISQTPVPTEIIFGSADAILPPNWIAQIKPLKARVTIIDKANHFFDGTSEFELVEEVEKTLRNLHGR